MKSLELRLSGIHHRILRIGSLNERQHYNILKKLQLKQKIIDLIVQQKTSFAGSSSVRMAASDWDQAAAGQVAVADVAEPVADPSFRSSDTTRHNIHSNSLYFSPK